jgi:transposase
MRAQEINRLQGPGIDDVRPSIQATIAFLEAQISEIESEINRTIDQDPSLRDKRKLLESIPGIGTTASMTLLGELPNILDFKNAKALAAFVGLCPREFRSGTSVSKSWVSKTGNKHVRRVLYMPAVTAIRFNPTLAEFAERLRAKGKAEKQIIVAVMRKLVVFAYGILKSAKPFDPALAP